MTAAEEKTVLAIIEIRTFQGEKTWALWGPLGGPSAFAQGSFSAQAAQVKSIVSLCDLTHFSFLGDSRGSKNQPF